ncbi:VOC family protein [Nocardia sp. CDC160]|uniref:VOC family protein n=1 Tax=Nocardia sp. CDC160 TaxID=3112166 RepID=UPI002DBEB3F4|nr:VOC family protein [Nocardia sp. CDC160]MEC3916399.1 VOC family protein [Nocardia sp. CDC160]
MNRLDHLVLATPDLAGTVETVGRLVGVKPVAGGAHPGRGTRNYLLGLGNGSYLEIIGPDPEQPEPELPRPFGIDDLSEARLTGWLVRVDDIEAAVAAARAAGYNPGDPAPLARETPDGRTLRWRLTFPLPSSGTQVVPALIDWGDTDHPADELPEVPLLGLEVVHPDPALVSTRLQALAIDIPVRPGPRAALIARIGTEDQPVTLL